MITARPETVKVALSRTMDRIVRMAYNAIYEEDLGLLLVLGDLHHEIEIYQKLKKLSEKGGDI